MIDSCTHKTSERISCIGQLRPPPSVSQRIHDSAMLLARAAELGVDLKPIKDYVDSFKYGDLDLHLYIPELYIWSASCI